MRDQITRALIELKLAASSATEFTYNDLLKKYDAIFSGDTFSHIYSIELCHSLNTHFKILISHSELASQLPDICAELQMPLVAMIPTNQVNEVSPLFLHYLVQLF